MTIKTVDVQKTKLQDLIAWVTAGTEIVLMEGNKPIGRIVPIATTGQSRVAGMHPGTIWTGDHFDDPLPDDCWGADSPRQE